MIKEKIVQLVADAVGEQFSLRTVALHIENAYLTIVGQVFVQNPNQLDFYAKPFEATVTRNKSKTFAIIPVQIIQSPDNAKGVRSVTDLEGTTRFYAVPIYALRSNCDAAKLYGYTWYGVRANSVEFLNLPKEVDKVIMECVVPFSAWEDAEDLPIPSAVADNIIALAIQTLKGETTVHSNAYKTK